MDLESLVDLFEDADLEDFGVAGYHEGELLDA